MRRRDDPAAPRCPENDHRRQSAAVTARLAGASLRTALVGARSELNATLLFTLVSFDRHTEARRTGCRSCSRPSKEVWYVSIAWQLGGGD